MTEAAPTMNDLAVAAFEEMAAASAAPAPSNSIPDLARAYVQAEEVVDGIEAKLKDAKKHSGKIEDELIRALEAAHMDGLKLDGLVVDLKKRDEFSMPREDDRDGRAKVIRWLSYHGMKNVIKKTVNYQTFGALCREMIEQGKKLHEAIVATPRKYISVRKG